MRGARRDTLIIARTDAVAVEGFDARHRRAPRSIARPAPTCCSSRRRASATSSAASVRLLRQATPLMANMVEGGKTPILPATELEALGFSLRDLSPAASCARWPRRRRSSMRSLKTHGTTDPFRARMFDFDALNELIGTPEMLERGKR